MGCYIFVNGISRFQGTMTGAHRRYLELIRDLSVSNQVTVISGALSMFDENKNVRQIVIPNNKIGILPYSWSGFVHSMAGLKKINKKDYDWAVSFGSMQTLAFKLNGISSILTMFRDDPINYMLCVEENPAVKILKYIYLHVLETASIISSKLIIVQCHDDYNNMLKRHFFLRQMIRKNSHIQLNNINPSWIETEEVLELPSVEGDMIQIAYIASFEDRRKGYDILFPALARLMKEGYGILLYVAGEGKILEKVRRDYGGYKNMVFLGQIKNSCALLRQVDFSLVPSHRDSCPNTVLESLAVGTTVYGSNVGGIKELLSVDFLFDDSEEGLYSFLKNKIDQNEWKTDNIRQRDLCCGLRFHWGEQIEGYMKEA